LQFFDDTKLLLRRGSGKHHLPIFANEELVGQKVTEKWRQLGKDAPSLLPLIFIHSHQVSTVEDKSTAIIWFLLASGISI
jgi:hypothetical protein